MNTKLDSTTESIMMLFPFIFKTLLKSKDKNEPVHIMSPKNRSLMVLKKNGVMPVSELGKKLCISKPNMTSLTDSLIKEGFIERSDNKNDRRIILLTITKKGETEAKKIFDNAKETVKENLSKLDEKDLEELCESIAKIKNIFSKIKGNDENGSKKC